MTCATPPDGRHGRVASRQVAVATPIRVKPWLLGSEPRIKFLVESPSTSTRMESV